MENNTAINLNDLQARGEIIEQFSIDPERDKEKEFEHPAVHREKKLFAYSDTPGCQDQKLDEITDPGQFQAFIKGVKSGGFGYYLGSPDVVFVTIYSFAV